jgi:hypothetical protein
MASTTRNPACGARGARNTDVAGKLINSDHNSSLAELQAIHVARRYRLTTWHAATIARLAFEYGEASR